MILDAQGKPRYYGVYRGVVYSNQDPLNRGRLRIKVPQVLADTPTEWAWPIEESAIRQAPPLAGQGVWVSFEGGDPSYPIWLGIFGNKITSEKEMYVRPFTDNEIAFNAGKVLQSLTLPNGEEVIDVAATLSKMASNLGGFTATIGGISGSLQAALDSLGLVVSGLSSTYSGTLKNATEVLTVDATTVLSGTTALVANPTTNGNSTYYTTAAGANFAVQLTTTGTNLEVNESYTYAFLVTNGATAYYPTSYTLDGTTITPKWQGGTAPSSGNANAIDAYTFVVVKTGAATYTVLASRTKFA